MPDPNAKRRSSFARTDRLKKEAAKTVEQTAAEHKAADLSRRSLLAKAEAKKAESERRMSGQGAAHVVEGSKAGGAA